MHSLLTWLRPQPSAEDLPDRFPSPFAMAPHPLARAAAEILQNELRVGAGFGHDYAVPGQGKMFGVLVVADEQGRVGFLRAVSGMLASRWLVEGFVPPLFEVAARDAFWPAGAERLAAIERKLDELVGGAEASALASKIRQLTRVHEDRLGELVELHRERRERRARERQRLGTPGSAAVERALQDLSDQSQADRRESKRLRKQQRREREVLARAEDELDRRRAALKRLRTETSNALLAQIQAGYRVVSARGESSTLAALFAPGVPPGGVGDCAGAKLLGYANLHRLRPLALAEFWWGASPVGGGRSGGQFYPACRGKCGPLLPFLLQGCDPEEAPLHGTAEFGNEFPRTLYEDEFLTVVDKPAGMLSVPGRSPRLHDSVLTRLRARYPSAQGPLLVHRLDLDTSGLLLMAKTPEVHRALQADFARRRVHKRYLAWLDGRVGPERGVVELALRVDIEDRPRQIYDPQHGKAAITEYRVLARVGEHTKVALAPRTGRTHQLRVHASHALGLGAPIVGDRLYGRSGRRLLLHAESLRFVHPRTRREVQVRSPVPEGFEPPSSTPSRS